MPRRRADMPRQRLHVRLVKPSVTRFDAVLEDPEALESYPIRQKLGFTGKLFVAPPNQSPPDWLEFVQTGISTPVGELRNRSNAAVLLLRRNGRLFAFPFGHGRHLLKDDVLVADFGLRAALNGLRPDSLRSLDSMTLEEQTVHRRTQSSRNASIGVFGLDVGRDILRAVVGAPRSSVPLDALAGAEASLVIEKAVDFAGLGLLCDDLLALYGADTYREHFPWVDNIKPVNDVLQTGILDEALLVDLRRGARATAYLAPPEPLDWLAVSGFGLPRRRGVREADLVLEHYLQTTDVDTLARPDLDRDRVLVFVGDQPQASKTWQVYKCLVFEHAAGDRRYVLSAGVWFEVDPSFARSIATTVKSFPVARVVLPAVQRDAAGKMEGEPAYNQRAAHGQPSVALLDRKLLRCGGASSTIEACDLFTATNQFVHVKHRKGGSSSLSHLFAQGRVAAEALVSDLAFREGLRDLLSRTKPGWETKIPLDRPRPAEFEVVFAILGCQAPQPAPELPFFSQLILARTGDVLQSLGYRVSVLGIQEAPTGAPAAGPLPKTKRTRRKAK